MPMIESSGLSLMIWALIGYGLGSLPFGLLLSRLMGLGDVRQIGSGNIGATNVLRTGSKLAAVLTLVFAAGKGAVAVILARVFALEDAVQLAALAAMLGHCYPIWLRFKGGKGVATFLGLVLALSWPVGAGCCLAWLIGAGVSRISSIGALVSAAAAPVLFLLFGLNALIGLALVLAVLVFWRHRANVARIRAGTEPRIGAS